MVLVTGADTAVVVAISVTLAGVDVEGVIEEGRLLAGLVEGHLGLLHVDPWGLGNSCEGVFQLITHLVHGWAENEGGVADVLVDPGDQQAWWEEEVGDLYKKLE